MSEWQLFAGCVVFVTAAVLFFFGVDCFRIGVRPRKPTSWRLRVFHVIIGAAITYAAVMALMNVVYFLRGY